MIRRLLLVLGIVLAVLVSAPGTASAAFTTRAAQASTVGTATIVGAASASTAGSTPCGFLQNNYSVTVSWTASPNGRIASYSLVESVNGVPRPAVSFRSTDALTFTRPANRAAFASMPTHTFAISATTTYGWTSPVPTTVSYTC